MKSIGFKRLAFVLARNAMQRTRPGDIDDNRQDDDEEAPEVYFNLHPVVNKALDGFIDDPETGYK